jgi:hypothetical protein
VLRRDPSGHHSLTQAGAGIHHDFTPFAGHRVRAEQDPRDICRHHVLDDDGNRHLPGVDPLTPPIGDGALRPQRSPAVHHGADHRLLADNVQEGVLLPGKRGAWQVLGGGAGTHRHRTAAQGGISCRDISVDVRRNLRPGEQRPDFCSGLQQPFQFGAQAGFRHQGGVGGGCDHKACWNGEAEAHEFAEIGALSASRRQVSGAEVGERTRKILSHRGLPGAGGAGCPSYRELLVL